VRLKHGSSTDVGLLRVTNEDAHSAEAELFIVADGMGGHNAGEVASALAVSTIKAGARSGLFDPVQFRDIVQQANTAIYTASLDDTDQRGMGTTVTALAVLPGSVPRVMVANVGDSRTYIFRDSELQPVSTDHSYVQELVNEGIITREEARTHPRRNIVTRALGIDRNVSVDVFTQEVRTGDRLLLCSDGLVDEVPDADIAGVLAQFSNPQECAEALVMLANTNGGRDNTTVIVVDVADDISAPVVVVPDDDDTGKVPVTPGTGTKKRRVTIGMTLFWSVLVAIVLGVVTVLGVYGRTGYFIGFTEDDTVAIWRGRAGGVLWFDPTVDTETTLTGDELPPDILRDVVTNRSFPSGVAAANFLQLVQQAVLNATTTTTVDDTTGATTTTTGD
jgi:protein phosphatase